MVAPRQCGPRRPSLGFGSTRMAAMSDEADLRRGRAVPRAVRGDVVAVRGRASGGRVRRGRRGASGARLHQRPDERDPRALASRGGGDRSGDDRPPRSPLLRDAVAAGDRPRRGARRAGAGAVEGVGADNGGGVQRGGREARQDRDRRLGGRRVRSELARHDRCGGRGDVLGGPPRPRPGAGRIDGGVRAERLPAPVRHRRRTARLARRARRRLRSRRSPEHGCAGGVHRRAGPVVRRDPRPATRVPRRPPGTLSRAGDAARPRRGSDRHRPHRHDAGVRPRRGRAGHPHAVEDPRRRSAVGGRC